MGTRSLFSTGVLPTKFTNLFTPPTIGGVSPDYFASFEKQKYFLNDASISQSSAITFSRSTTGTFTDASGVVQTAAINAPRFDYSTGVVGLLMEGARTNLCLHSEDLTNAAWVKVDSTITANNTTAPDGTTTADLVTEGVAGTAEIAQTVTIGAGATHSDSIYLKRGNTDWIRIEATETTSVNGFRTWVNLATGEIGTQTNIGTGTVGTVIVQTLSNGWYRVQLKTTVAAAVTAKIRISSATADNSTTRVNNATYFAWGGQVEVGEFSSSYIPTVGSTVTRAQDLCTVNSFGSWYSASAMTLVCNYVALGAGSATGQNVYNINDNTANNSISHFVNPDPSPSDVVFEVKVATVNVVQGSFSNQVAVRDQERTAFALQLNNFAFTVNGQTPVTDASGTIPTVSQCNLGNRSDGLRPFFGILRTFGSYPVRASDANIQGFTQ